MTDLIKTILCPIALVSGALISGASQAATYTQIPTVPDGVNCMPLGINDSGRAVGNCTKIGNGANLIPWVANAGSAQVALPSLVAGQGCKANTISNANWIMGFCNRADSVATGVVWKGDVPANPPIVLNPLPATILPLPIRAADVRTVPTAMNERGGVVGWSISENDRATSVLWAAGSGTPQFIFPAGLLAQRYEDECSPVDVNLTLVNGYPSVALNCPGPGGEVIPRVATRGTTGYVMTDLAFPTGADYCVISGINDRLNVAGQCFYPNSDINVTKAASWTTPASAPQVLNTSVGTASSTININNNGFILISRSDGTGNVSNAVWFPTPTPIQVPVDVMPPANMTWPEAMSIRANSTSTVVALSLINGSQHRVGCTWTNAAGVVCIPAINGGLASNITAMSPNAGYVVGVVKDGTQTAIAVQATLP
ncbi:hypothetical protein ACUN0G_30205 [Pseudomonas sp. 32A]|uniref:hypothetical protein n=1 Tax=Pseudomonas sp. 32A TaxID=651185 RepID=UPI004045E4FF